MRTPTAAPLVGVKSKGAEPALLRIKPSAKCLKYVNLKTVDNFEALTGIQRNLAAQPVS